MRGRRAARYTARACDRVDAAGPRPGARERKSHVPGRPDQSCCYAVNFNTCTPRRDRTLVKTWAMRGTLHLVASDELPELVGGARHEDQLAATGVAPVLRGHQGGDARPPGRDRRRAHRHADDPRRPRRRPCAKHLGNEAFADRVTSSWGTFLKPAASRGLLCFGPDDGRNVTFVDPRAWLGREMPEPSEDAIGAVIERQLTAFPGSSKGELARWWGVQGGAPLRKPIASPRRPRRRGPGGRHEGAGPARRRRRARATSTPSTAAPPAARLRPLHAVAAEGGRAAAAAAPGDRWCRGPPAGSARW